jgi:replicative DNA helicase
MLNIPLDIFIEEKESYLIMTIRENVIDSRHKKILTFVSIDSFRQAKFDGGF